MNEKWEKNGMEWMLVPTFIFRERSFSEQALIHTSRRLLKVCTVNNLMIKYNLKFSQRQGIEQHLRKYLFDNNPLRLLLGK